MAGGAPREAADFVMRMQTGIHRGLDANWAINPGRSTPLLRGAGACYLERLTSSRSIMADDITDYIVTTEVDQGPAFADAIFQRKYRQDVPEFAHHIVAFVRKAPDHFVPASYLHFTDCGDIYLVGGGCTDGRAFAHMNEAQAQAVNAAGGLLLQTLRYGFTRFGPRCEVIFGQCNDPRAYEVDMQAGFRPTEIEQLLMYCPRPVQSPRLHELTRKACSFMPF